MLQQDTQNRLRTGLVYNRHLSSRQFVHRMKFSQLKAKDYTKILKGIGWGLAGALAFYAAVQFGALALFSGYTWLGLSVVNPAPAAHAANAGIVLLAGLGATVLSSASAFCFQHLGKN